MAAMRILPHLLLCLPACTVTVSSHSAWNQRSAAGLVDHDGREVVQVASPDEARQVALQLASSCTAGSLRVRVLDAHGTVLCDDLLAAGERVTALQWPAGPGVWQCELSFEHFSGNYSVELKACDQPLRVSVGVSGVEFESDK